MTWLRALLTLIFKKDGFYQQAQHESDKKRKITEKNELKKIGDFFDMTSSKKGRGSWLS